MKVCYNACYGGFGLSEEAINMIAELKGSDGSDGVAWILDKNRNDPELIQTIETLGEKANGTYADLKIATIPDGADYEIDDYDGMESVEPPRQSWG